MGRTVVAAIAIPLAWEVNRVRNQRLAVAEIQRLHGRAVSNYRSPPSTVFGKWLEDTLGNDFFSPVVQVLVDDPDITDDTIARVAKLAHLSCLDLKSDKITLRMGCGASQWRASTLP